LRVVLGHERIGQVPALARARVSGAMSMRLAREIEPMWRGLKSMEILNSIWG
jgi:hypothetical protein